MNAPQPRRSTTAGPARERRARVTRRSVRVAERVSRALVTFGGMGTILAVVTIFGFLLWVVIPLFQGAEVGEAAAQPAQARTADAVAVGSDEHGVLAWSVFADGTLEVLSRESNTPLLEQRLTEGPAPTALSISPDGGSSVLGFADGSVRLLRIGFSARLLDVETLPEALAALPVGGRALHEGGVAEKLAGGEVRLQRLAVTLGEPIALAQGPIVCLDRSDLSSGYALATVEADGTATLHRIEERRNLLNRNQPPVISRASATLPYEHTAGAALPLAIRVPGAGDNVYLIWADGRTLRFDTRDLDAPRLAETLDLVPEAQARVTAVGWLLGRTTLVTGDSEGRIRGWFRTKPSASTTLDGSTLEAAHLLEGPAAPVLSFSAGQRTRLLAAGYADGSARVFHVTSGAELARVGPLAAQGAVAAQGVGGQALAVGLSPKEDAIFVRSGGSLARWSLRARHPEASLGAVFGKVWYEGLAKPEHVWQSTGGTDDFEPKLGLVPLVFGTLKATVYSMLFGVPIALLAAVFTSEFLSARLRTSVKSMIEIMASLPSVVLGFLAAIVIAPFVQQVVPTVLVSFLVLPTVLLLGAHLWQLLPNHLAIRFAGAPKLACVVAVFPLSILLSSALAPTFERVLFRGDLGAWLNHEVSHDELAAAGLPVPAQPVGEDAPDRALLAGLVAGRTAAGVSADRAQAVLHEAAFQAAGRLPRAQPSVPSGAPAAAPSGAAPPGGILIAPPTPLLTAPEIERVRAAHQAGGSGGWTFLLMPVAVACVLFAVARWVNPRLRQASKHWSRARCALVALLKFTLGVGASLLVAGLLGWAFSQAGLDPRGDFDDATRGAGAVMGSPVQRNALVVGFLMGFAIIPIIYTLAEDALSSVPQQLRLGSLGAGATPWQTATRIIIPTAMSGLFSAVMIGLGRAVGETMIVLMAAGNTSVLEWNMFNGFRTLSANIATEMPEAVVGSTHYRVLFLAAFALFAITFVLNTIAEAVRQRFRKRAFQL